jgi:hypothetical protein
MREEKPKCRKIIFHVMFRLTLSLHLTMGLCRGLMNYIDTKANVVIKKIDL